jgi:hypothetical protein
LTYEEKPTKSLDEKWKQLRNRAIKYCRVQWKHHLERQATWEKEDDLCRDYPNLFRYLVPATSGRSSYKEERMLHPHI